MLTGPALISITVSMFGLPDFCEDLNLKFPMFKTTALRRLCMVVALTCATALSSACAPVMETHGYFSKKEDLDAAREGGLSQREIEMMMGSPSTIAAFDPNTWYYIGSITNAFAWKAPVVISRHVVAIQFDEETKTVKDVKEYTVLDGRVIAFSDDVTPTKGRELSVLEQLLGNVGRTSADQIFDDDDGRREQ